MKFLLLLAIRIYQAFGFIFRPRCRYWPSCSEYMHESIQRHGIVSGVRLGLRRVSKCHPWGGHGFDPVPVKL